MITDISERRNSEEALRESEQMYRTIVKAAPGLLLICAPNGKNVYVSANCKNMTGYSQEEMMGKLICWLHEDDRPRMKMVLKEALNFQNGGHNIEFKGIRKDGEIWYGCLSWEPVKDSQDNLSQVVMQVTEITDRKTGEESLKQPKKQFSDIVINSRMRLR